MVFRTFTPTDERPQIGEAVAVVVSNIKTGRPTTSLVFPPRFGKSDIIRAAALELEAVFGAVSVVFVPWVFLRDQILDDRRVKKTVDRLAIRRPFEYDELGTATFFGNFYRQRPLRTLWAMTIHAGRQRENILALKDAAGMLQREGRMLVAFIDESHMVSTDASGWTDLARELQATSVHIVLLTGSPYRSDDIAPFGFGVTELSRSPVQYCVPTFDANGQPVTRTYACDKIGYALKADLEVSRETAWQTGALTPIQARWVDFTADAVDVSGINDIGEARKALTIGVRDPDVIRKFAEILCDDVTMRRKTMADSAAIVYVGNDRADETMDATHTKQVAQIVCEEWMKRFGRPPKIVIAMLKDSEAGSRAEANKIGSS